jgi:hypothetical protein
MATCALRYCSSNPQPAVPAGMPRLISIISAAMTRPRTCAVAVRVGWPGRPGARFRPGSAARRRHMRQLESAGLIQVAASRMVSGILEQRYQAAQRDLSLAATFLQENVEEAECLGRALLDHVRDGFFAAYRASHPPSGAADSGKTTMMHAMVRLTPERAAEFRAKLTELLGWFDEADSHDPADDEVNLLVGSYTTPDSRSR